MAHAMDELLNSNTLSEEVRSSLSEAWETQLTDCLLYTSPSPRDKRQYRMPSSA